MPEFLSVNQLADLLGVSRHTIFSMTRNRARGPEQIPHLKIGTRLRFRRSSVDAWIAAKEQAARG
jgi:excisionase family DNA binding protein